MYELKTITDVRKWFWMLHPQYKSDYRVKKRQNDYKTDIRVDFVYMVDSLVRDGRISEKLGQGVTL